MVQLFQRMLAGVNDTIAASIIQQWECNKQTSTNDLINRLRKNVTDEAARCDIVIAPIIMDYKRKEFMKFIGGVYYTYAIPVIRARVDQDMSVRSQLLFWTRPFRPEAW